MNQAVNIMDMNFLSMAGIPTDAKAVDAKLAVNPELPLFIELLLNQSESMNEIALSKNDPLQITGDNTDAADDIFINAAGLLSVINLPQENAGQPEPGSSDAAISNTSDNLITAEKLLLNSDIPDTKIIIDNIAKPVIDAEIRNLLKPEMAVTATESGPLDDQTSHSRESSQKQSLGNPKAISIENMEMKISDKDISLKSKFGKITNPNINGTIELKINDTALQKVQSIRAGQSDLKHWPQNNNNISPAMQNDLNLHGEKLNVRDVMISSAKSNPTSFESQVNADTAITSGMNPAKSQISVRAALITDDLPVIKMAGIRAGNINKIKPSESKPITVSDRHNILLPKTGNSIKSEPLVENIKLTDENVQSAAKNEIEKNLAEKTVNKNVKGLDGSENQAGNKTISRNNTEIRFQTAGLESITNTKSIDSPKAIRVTGPVRFAYPDNIDKSAIKNIQTIQIRMIPEQLGAIRLTLTSHNGALYGRMIVDNAQAYQAVESNINQLINDLADQGVKVDSFDISLAGENAGRQHANYRPGQIPHRYSDYPGSDLKEDQDNYQAAPVRRANYVGRAGVDLLA